MVNAPRRKRKHRGDSRKSKKTKASKASGVRSPRSKVAYDFGGGELSTFGGVTLIQRLFVATGLSDLLVRHFRSCRRVVRYTAADYVQFLLTGMLLGFDRVSQLARLAGDPVVASALRLPGIPHFVSVWRFVCSLRMHHIKQLQAMQRDLLEWAWGQDERRRGFRRRSVTLDLDSTVCTVYGRQHGAKKGYNPGRRGEKSYRPLVAFVAQTREIVHALLRPGDAADTRRLVPFVKAALDALPAGITKLTLRADCGFFAGDLLDLLEEEARTRGIVIRYIVVARRTETIKAKLPQVDFTYHQGLPVAYGEFSAKLNGWKRARRFVVVRHDPEEKPSDQLELFPTTPYTYRIFVTNLPVSPAWVLNHYDGRANCENMIKEAKLDLPLGKPPTRGFGPNSAYFQLVVLAYNHSLWLERFALHSKNVVRHKTLESVRRDYLVIAAKFVRHGGRETVRLSSCYPYQEEFNRAANRLETLPPPRRRIAA